MLIIDNFFDICERKLIVVEALVELTTQPVSYLKKKKRKKGKKKITLNSSSSYSLLFWTQFRTKEGWVWFIFK